MTLKIKSEKTNGKYCDFCADIAVLEVRKNNYCIFCVKKIQCISCGGKMSMQSILFNEYKHEACLNHDRKKLLFP